jgi:hypothetical protein
MHMDHSFFPIVVGDAATTDVLCLDGACESCGEHDGVGSVLTTVVTLHFLVSRDLDSGCIV